jgi:SAM-dependent methyltransferase
LPLIDLGSAPPSNAYLTEAGLHAPEQWFPLRVLVCRKCWLVQTADFARAEEFFDANYSYFSSFSTSWLAHCEHYVHDVSERFSLSSSSHVVEIAANDGYLMKYFMLRGIPCIGVEPTASTAASARLKGVKIIEGFFGLDMAEELVSQSKQADLMVANNVLAHVPDINDFVAGFTLLLKPYGVATFEFPHLLHLMAKNQFDTIYHEHFSYLSFTVVRDIFANNGLTIFDVQELTTHGGSLRIFAQRADTAQHSLCDSVADLLEREKRIHMHTKGYYTGLQLRAEKVKDDLVHFLIEAKRAGKKVVGFGAAAKGNTLLNFAGIRPDLIPYVVDNNPAKQGKFMPGSRIPIYEPSILEREPPDYLLILPWNILSEVRQQYSMLIDLGTKFVTAVPKLEII